MNIQEAKKQIKNAMIAYFTRDEYGNYVIPMEAQRPVCIMGPPGIGKTAIMSQIAEEMGVGYISYSMTHHTRQSALGLPFITEKEYMGQAYRVSEYTMSEIIRSVYDEIEEGGRAEGILFLDEINCVSETLNPAMLQFLQYKIFGMHRIPEGWIVVTAGNPLEFNRSAREFDTVTWDRLKRIDVEPDYAVWKKYANQKNVHPSILAFLDLYEDYFYSVVTSMEGRKIVTARGWEDLSDMIRLYEWNQLEVEETLIRQYIQNEEIAEKYADYYAMYHKYEAEYDVAGILDGTLQETVSAKVKAADFDEKLMLMEFVLSRLKREVRRKLDHKIVLDGIREILKSKDEASYDAEELHEAAKKQKEKMLQYEHASREKVKIQEEIIRFFCEEKKNSNSFAEGKSNYNAKVKAFQEEIRKIQNEMTNLFAFYEKISEDGNEILLILTRMTTDWHIARFLMWYGSESYNAYSERMNFEDRRKKLMEKASLYTENDK